MLLDTSGLLCLIDKREPQRSAAQAYFAAASIRLTHSYVLSELIALAQARGVPREAALEFASDIADSDDVEVVWVPEDLHGRAMNLLKEHLDKEWSRCDSVSFVIMEERGLLEALTTDHYFEQAGFVRLLT